MAKKNKSNKPNLIEDENTLKIDPDYLEYMIIQNSDNINKQEILFKMKNKTTQHGYEVENESMSQLWNSIFQYNKLHKDAFKIFRKEEHYNKTIIIHKDALKKFTFTKMFNGITYIKSQEFNII